MNRRVDCAEATQPTRQSLSLAAPDSSGPTAIGTRNGGPFPWAGVAAVISALAALVAALAQLLR